MVVELTAGQCRERARICFGLGVAELEESRRERHLRDGEMWMARWRLWTPGNAPLGEVAERPVRSA